MQNAPLNRRDICRTNLRKVNLITLVFAPNSPQEVFQLLACFFDDNRYIGAGRIAFRGVHDNTFRKVYHYFQKVHLHPLPAPMVVVSERYDCIPTANPATKQVTYNQTKWYFMDSAPMDGKGQSAADVRWTSLFFWPHLLLQAGEPIEYSRQNIYKAYVLST